MADLAFDGYACIDAVEEGIGKLDEVARKFGGGFRTSDGVGFAVKSVLELAREFLRLCPVQPGDRVMLAERIDCSKSAWNQHTFEAGNTGEVVAIDYASKYVGTPHYVALIQWDHDYWTDLDGNKREVEPDRRHVFPGVPVSKLAKEERDGK